MEPLSVLSSLQKLPAIFVVLLPLLLGACFPGVYKLDIPQGNILEKEKVDQLKVGMNKRQVRYLLGTPLVIDSFEQDRWDYYYSYRYYVPRTNEPIDRKARLVLTFEKGQLVTIDRHLPQDAAQEAPAPAPVPDPEVPETSESPVEKTAP